MPTVGELLRKVVESVAVVAACAGLSAFATFGGFTVENTEFPRPSAVEEPEPTPEDGDPERARQGSNLRPSA